MVYFWHSEGWSVRNEALMSTVLNVFANTRSHWIIACDAHMEANDFAQGHWVKEARARVKAPTQGSATYCAKGAGGLEIRKTQDYFVVSESLDGKIENVVVINEYLTSPRNAVKCTNTLHKSETWVKPLKVPTKLELVENSK